MEESQEKECLHGRKEGNENQQTPGKSNESWQVGVRMVNKRMTGFYGKKNKSQRKGGTQNDKGRCGTLREFKSELKSRGHITHQT